jgi:hypothetical protein
VKPKGSRWDPKTKVSEQSTPFSHFLFYLLNYHFPFRKGIPNMKARLLRALELMALVAMSACFSSAATTSIVPTARVSAMNFVERVLRSDVEL